MLLVACLMSSMSVVAAEVEAYAYYSSSFKTLTFYYDNQRNFRIGTTYDLNVGENYPDWYSDGTCADVTKVVFDASFSDALPHSTHAWFRDMTYLTSITGIENLNTSMVTNMARMFMNCQYLTSIDLSHFNTASVTNMFYMFYGCSRLSHLDLSNFNTAYVTNMGGMFVDCDILTSLDLSSFNTANVNNMMGMFSSCNALTNLNLTSFNTAKVTNMGSMFSYCNALTTINVGSHWTTSSVTQSSNMFYNCPNLVGGAGTTYSSTHTDASYGHIDGGTSNPGYLSAGTEAYACYSPTNATLTFYYDKLRSTRTGTTYDLPQFIVTDDDLPAWYNDSTCRSVTRVVFNSSFANARPKLTCYWFADMENLQMITGMRNYLNTSNVKNMTYMFLNCKQLTSIDVSNFNTDKAEYMGGIFFGCKNLTSIDVSNFNTSNASETALMFANCENLTSLDLSNFNTAKVNSMWGMFRDCTNLTTLDVSNFNTANVTDMFALFEGCTNLTTLDISNFNTAKVTDMRAMFYDCRNLTTLDLSNFNTANVEEMRYMFANCLNLTSLDVSHFNTAKVTNMDAMFGACNSLTSLDVTSFNTSNVTDMYDMFYACLSLTRLDLSNFNTAKVTDMGYMFSWNRDLVSIYVDDGWNTEAVTNSYMMFNDCTSLRGDLGTTYDPDHVDKSYAHLDGGPSNPGYLSMKPEFIRGDVNNDGNINISDVTALINYLLSQNATGLNLDAANCNLDNTINISDVTTLINYLLSGNWLAGAMAPATTTTARLLPMSVKPHELAMPHAKALSH